MKPILSRNREKQDAQPTYNAHVYNLINVYELRRFCLDHPRMDSKELLCFITRCFADQVEAACLVSDLPHSDGPHPLEQYAALRPTHEQVRTALLRLLDMPCPTDSSKPLLWQKQHWLAVMRVLQFLGIIGTDYACRQRFTQYINSLLENHIKPIDAQSIKRIDSEKVFNRPLQEWYGKLHAERTKYYWDISMTFLEYMSEANRSKFLKN